MSDPGTLIWITGLPGAGKTTLALEVVRRLKEADAAVVRLDGDLFREVMGHDVGYDREGRLTNARRLVRLCKLLTDQGITVVCATVSLFRECHAWNRAHVPRYLEVFLRVTRETLVARDQKGLMTQALACAAPHVIGINQDFEVPDAPHLTIDNDDGGEPLAASAERIVRMVAR